MLYMVTFTINIPPMLAYIPYMDPMGSEIHPIACRFSRTEPRAKGFLRGHRRTRHARCARFALAAAATQQAAQSGLQWPWGLQWLKQQEKKGEDSHFMGLVEGNIYMGNVIYIFKGTLYESTYIDG